MNQIPIFALLMIAMSLMDFNGAQAHTQGNALMFPENKLSIPVQSEAFRLSGGINQQEFNAIIEKITEVYTPVFESMGGKLVVRRMWDVDSVNAITYRVEQEYRIDMYGGLARHSAATPDGFALVMCHEIGHHLGGFPQKKARPVSNEGQSDYFASMKCFRKVFEREDHASVLSNLVIPEKVKSQCTESFKSVNEINLCMRTAMAGMSLATISWFVENDEFSTIPKPSFDESATEVVVSTVDSHPKAQCRLDTYYAGALCNVSHSIPFGENDPVTGACSVEKGDRIGVRPACWYKAKLLI